MARVLIALGLLLVLAGVGLLLYPRALSWFGNLPGDIDIRRGGTRIFIPISSMLAVSVVFTVAVNLVAWLMRNLR